MRLLIVDDEELQRGMLARYLEGAGHDVTQAEDAATALRLLGEEEFEVALTDVRLADEDGIDLVATARAGGCTAEFLVLTAYGTIENAVAAIRAGAQDYLTKPVRLEELEEALGRLGRLRERQAGAAPAPRPPPEEDPFDGLGAAMGRVRELVERVAASEATVLVCGESGSGKEIVANRLHAASRRANGPLVKINCAALPDTLLETELFGCVRGAFTGAETDRAGLFEAAAGGTILLDEIGDVSPALQVRLLRVLQEREVCRLGSTQPVALDCRIIAATNRDLVACVAQGSFREDLLYRLRVVEVVVPPLRDRPEDVAVLAERLLRRHARRNRVPHKPLTTEALLALARYPFPGNVRQLEHLLESALLLSRGAAVELEDLPPEVRRHDGEPPPRGLPAAVASLERAWIRQALAEADGVQSRAARLLGISERVLRYKLAKYRVPSSTSSNPGPSGSDENVEGGSS